MNIALLLGGTLVAFLLAEAGMRLLNPPQFATHHHPCIYTEDDEIGYVYAPNASDWSSRTAEMISFVKTNSLGFHDIEHDWEDTAGGVRIVVLGDSTTAALEVDVTEGWTRILQQELRRQAVPAARVFNLGLSGTGTDVHLTLLRRHLSLLQPDIVILAFFWNDIKDIGRPTLYKSCYRGYVLAYMNDEQEALMKAALDQRMPGAFTFWLFERSYVFRAVSSFFGRNILLHQNHLGPPDLGMPKTEGVKKEKGKSEVRPWLRRIFNQFIHLSNKHDFRFIVMPLPCKKGISTCVETLEKYVPPRTVERLEIIDLSPAVLDLVGEEGREYHELFWETDAHFNVYGNLVLGRAVARTLISQSITLP